MPTCPTIDYDRLAACLPAVREHLLLCWGFSKAKYVASAFHASQWRPRLYCASAGFCRHTSLFLQRLLLRAGHGRWASAGGGCYDHLDGRYSQHWWLERDGLILDLTADQFDSVQIVLCESDHPFYRRDEESSRQTRISTLMGVVSQWEGEGFSFWDAPEATRAIHESYKALCAHLEC